MASESDREPVINSNPKLQSYYHSLESRIGYRLLLGGTRHFGFYENDTWWPFLISKALRAVEDKLAASLNLPPGAYVLDAGCGVGHVAINLATKYGKNITQSALPENQITVQRMDYHHLERFGGETFDGVYTMETFVHATDPEAVLAGFFHILRPEGHLSLFEYDHELRDDSPEAMVRSMRQINEFAAMPTNSRSHPGVFRQMLEDAGFGDIIVRDYSDNIRPKTRLFYLITYIPFLIVTFLGLEHYFIKYRRESSVLSWPNETGGPLEAVKDQ
ncbi:S-adenosyl-L-methionine-dependent methyltransferase [Aspergillus minisclerotigenes]|uniref:S-adenosyl-L-methionine-dependent methyltransferase n=1 Tax=Aspergillus minisclerotigenes TaxID=656917 RepID=A0A5N6J336_9EURO|nr:S-adenosyl-L-methionine-dependent methyltransferase [Aspergillus minisclerotigenes]